MPEENTITFSVQLDTVCFTEKPKGREVIGGIKNRTAAQPGNSLHTGTACRSCTTGKNLQPRYLTRRCKSGKLDKAAAVLS